MDVHKDFNQYFTTPLTLNSISIFLISFAQLMFGFSVHTKRQVNNDITLGNTQGMKKFRNEKCALGKTTGDVNKSYNDDQILPIVKVQNLGRV